MTEFGDLPPVSNDLFGDFPDVEAWLMDKSYTVPAPPPKRINRFIQPPKDQTPEERETHARLIYGLITTIAIPKRFVEVWGDKIPEQDFRANQAEYIQSFIKQDPVAKDWHRAVVRLLKRAGVKEL